MRSVSLGFWIGAGSRDERDAKAGISHFIEHLLFKGSRSYSAQEIAEVFDSLGGELNAATSREHTVVYARVADHHLETAIDVMTDMIFAPVFADLDSEREVVLEEIAMYEDTPQDLVHDLVTEAVFGAHPLGRPVIGSADVISTVSRRSVAEFPPRDVRPRQHRGRRRRKRRARAPRPAPRAGDLEAHERRSAEAPCALAARQDAAAGSPLPAQGHRAVPRLPGRARHRALRPAAFRRLAPGRILGGSASSRFFQEIREKRGMAYSVYTFASQYTDTGQIGFYVGTREENLPACLEIAVAEIADIADGNLRGSELERAKENLKGRIMLAMESTASRMSRLGKSLITDTELLSLDRLGAEIDAVTPEAVSELAGVLLAPERFRLRDRAERGLVPGRGRARESRAGRPAPVAA